MTVAGISYKHGRNLKIKVSCLVEGKTHYREGGKCQKIFKKGNILPFRTSYS